MFGFELTFQGGICNFWIHAPNVSIVSTQIVALLGACFTGVPHPHHRDIVRRSTVSKIVDAFRIRTWPCYFSWHKPSSMMFHKHVSIGAGLAHTTRSRRHVWCMHWTTLWTRSSACMGCVDGKPIALKMIMGYRWVIPKWCKTWLGHKYLTAFICFYSITLMLVSSHVSSCSAMLTAYDSADVSINRGKVGAGTWAIHVWAPQLPKPSLQTDKASEQKNILQQHDATKGFHQSWCFKLLLVCQILWFQGTSLVWSFRSGSCTCDM